MVIVIKMLVFRLSSWTVPRLLTVTERLEVKYLLTVLLLLEIIGCVISKKLHNTSNDD